MHPQAELVDRAPRLRRHDVARRAHALARERERRPHRARVVAVGDEEALRRVVDGLGCSSRYSSAPPVIWTQRVPGDRPRAAGRAADCRRRARAATSSRRARDSAPSSRCARRRATGGSARSISRSFDRVTATIQVSLLPPPCDELTTSEPRRSATRVRPPGVTQSRGPAG